MIIITSKENENIKSIKKLKEKKFREEYKEFIIEGEKLISEAIAENVTIAKVVVCSDCIEKEAFSKELLYKISKYEIIYVTENVFKTLTDVVTPQGILAIVEMNKQKAEINLNENIIIALENISDPGNLGTILRTIDSAGIKQVVLSENCIDIYNNKVIRATMGAIFRLNIIKTENFIQTLRQIQENNFEILATTPNTDITIYDVDYNKKVILIGNEGSGLTKESLELADIKIKIPMIGKTESLNASVATGIIIYEYVRKITI